MEAAACTSSQPGALPPHSSSHDTCGVHIPDPKPSPVKLHSSFTRGHLFAHPRSREPCHHIRPRMNLAASTFPVRDRNPSIFNPMFFPLEICPKSRYKNVAIILCRPSGLRPFFLLVGAVGTRFSKFVFIFYAPKGAVPAQDISILRLFLGRRTLNAGLRLRGHPR